MYYLYAIVDQPERRLPALNGLGEALISKVHYRDLAAVVSPLTTSEVPALETNVWRHESILESLMAERAVLPVRFGTVLASEHAAEIALREHYPGFLASLDLVRDRVEMSLRVLLPEEPAGMAVISETPSPGTGEGVGGGVSSGRAYMLARLEEERTLLATRAQAESQAAELHEPLAALAAQNTCEVLTTPRLLLTATYLVERAGVEAFRRELERLNAAYCHLGFLCTGPWPPYSFVSAALASGD